MHKGIGLLVGVIGFCALSAMPANAVQITSLAGLTSNDSIDWSQLGPAGTGITGAHAVISVGGVNATVSSGGNFLVRLDQGLGWFGNFANGDHLLYTGAI